MASEEIERTGGRIGSVLNVPIVQQQIPALTYKKEDGKWDSSFESVISP